jgi:hypothetical protein
VLPVVQKCYHAGARRVFLPLAFAVLSQISHGAVRPKPLTLLPRPPGGLRVAEPFGSTCSEPQPGQGPHPMRDPLGACPLGSCTLRSVVALLSGKAHFFCIASRASSYGNSPAQTCTALWPPWPAPKRLLRRAIAWRAAETFGAPPLDASKSAAWTGSKNYPLRAVRSSACSPIVPSER